jgi:mRNA interferase MazF
MPAANPVRGEVWQVALDPAIGSEIQKTRPCAVLSSDHYGRLPVKLVVPLTEYKPHFQSILWLVRIEPSAENGLSKASAADCLQVRACSTLRFQGRLGRTSEEDISRIAAAVAILVEAPRGR